nr:ribonuclease H-like domain-containing protein [Tanacetum cinerariifolium]
MMVDLFPLEMVKVEYLEKLLDEIQVLLRVPRKDNIDNVDLKGVVPTKGLTCLFAKATIDESNLWYRRLSIMIQFCDIKGIKKEFSVPRTPQQNGVAKRKNRTLIDATRTISPVSTAGPSFVNVASPSPINVAGTLASTNAFKEHPFERFSPFKNAFSLPYVPIVTPINDTRIFGNAYDDEATWNKKDERGIVIKNKARLVAQEHTQEEGIDYDEVFAPVARIKSIRLFLAYASFKDFVVYQMDVKNAFLYGRI